MTDDECWHAAHVEIAELLGEEPPPNPKARLEEMRKRRAEQQKMAMRLYGMSAPFTARDDMMAQYMQMQAAGAAQFGLAGLCWDARARMMPDFYGRLHGGLYGKKTA
jgi:hypothetical protein